MGRKIKIRLFFVYLFSILPFLIFIFYLFDLWYDTRRTQVIEQNIKYATLAGEYINNTIGEGQTISQLIIMNPYFLSMLSKKDITPLNLYFENITDNFPNIHNINLFNPNGVPLASSSQEVVSQEQISIKDRDYFQEVLKTKKMAISPMTLGRYTAKRLIVVASPAIEKGEISAVIVVTVNIDVLKSSIEEVIKKENKDNNTLILLDNQGQLAFIANQPYPSEDEIDKMANNTCFTDANKGKIHIMENTVLPLVDKTQLGACVPINHKGWVVASVMPMEGIYAPIFKIQKFIWVIIGTGLLFAGGLFSFFLRKVRIVY